MQKQAAGPESLPPGCSFRSPGPLFPAPGEAPQSLQEIDTERERQPPPLSAFTGRWDSPPPGIPLGEGPHSRPWQEALNQREGGFSKTDSRAGAPSRPVVLLSPWAHPSPRPGRPRSPSRRLIRSGKDSFFPAQPLPESYTPLPRNPSREGPHSRPWQEALNQREGGFSKTVSRAEVPPARLFFGGRSGGRGVHLPILKLAL